MTAVMTKRQQPMMEALQLMDQAKSLGRMRCKEHVDAVIVACFEDAAIGERDMPKF